MFVMNDAAKITVGNSSKKLLLSCRLDTPFLGNIHSRDKIMRFDIVKSGTDNWLRTNMPQWRWALREAMDSIGILAESNVDYVRLPIKVKAPSIRYYSLRGSAKDNGKSSTYECFQAGTVLTFPVFILSQLEGDDGMQGLFKQRPPTEQEVMECFSTIGECIGLSPWGSKSGYGRFTIETGE